MLTGATRIADCSLLASVLLIAVLSAASVWAADGPRLSADLADHLTAGSAVIHVIVHGTRPEIVATAQRYNVTIERFLRGGGAVLQVNAGQLAAMQIDESIDHLSGD